MREADGVVPRFLIRDRDRMFTRTFDEVFWADGVRIVKTPVQAPNANAVAERWVRTVRQECLDWLLDWLLVWGRRHLERVLDEYVRHYNHERPHRSRGLRPPTAVDAEPEHAGSTTVATVRRRDRLGGLIHEYYQVAA